VNPSLFKIGVALMNNHAVKLVELYRAFYRADKSHNPSARKSIQPLYDGYEVICRADQFLRSPETLPYVVGGQISKLMQQIRGNNALGRFVIADLVKERQAVFEFSKYLVIDVFYGSFDGNIARFAGKQRGFLEDTCEYLYRIAQDTENATKE
jgi:CRISPR-associated protein Csc3